MPTATYREFRVVLQRAGFQLVRSRKHETWEKSLPAGEILQVRLSHQAEEIHTLIPQSRLAIFEHSGHSPHIEEREAFARELRAFLGHPS